MKKFISVFLCIVVFTVNVIFTPYVTTVYASGIVTDIAKSISFDNVVKMVKSLYKVGYNVATTGSGDGAASSKALDSIWDEDSAVNKWLQTKLFPFMDANRNIDLTNPDSPITYDKDKQLVEFNPTFTTELNQQLQDSVHALDGYYLFEPANPDLSASVPAIQAFFIKLYKNNPRIYSCASSSSFLSALNEWYKKREYGVVFVPTLGSNGDGFYINGININRPVAIPLPYLDNDTSEYMFCDGSFLGVYKPDKDSYYNGSFYTISCGTSLSYFPEGSVSGNSVIPFLKSCMGFAYGPSFKLFYSLTDLKKYLNNGKQRTFAPKLPSTTISIPIKYINNTTNLPDLSFNLDSLIGKAEADIQAGLDAQLKIYLDKLADVNISPDKPVNPTPTPSGGGSGGDFGDGTTPTPKPDFSDGSLTDTNTLLQKILDKLTEFSTNHDKLAKIITNYIEKNDGKLEEILIAIQALSDGKTETEQNGCKYDFKALSKYLTDLWNNSDKKFDEMVKLLEENNKYQQKLVDSLNEIKALLIADTVMDFFKDRSQETAEKAKDKFPTSIPWDISLVLNSMSAEPKNPKFSLPIKIESLKINETIDIDLSTDEWEKLAKTYRYILSVTFILFLIHLSRKLFSSGGDD